MLIRNTKILYFLDHGFLDIVIRYCIQQIHNK